MACRSDLSSCASACAHHSSFRDLSEHSKPSPSPTALDSPSIYVTFKVLKLVSALRLRVTRKHTTQAKSKRSSPQCTAAGNNFYREVDLHAAKEIDRYLGRTVRRGKETRPSRAAAGGKGIERLLGQLELSVRFGPDSTQAIAHSNKLFLGQQSALSIRRLSEKDLCEVLVLVEELVAYLQAHRAARDVLDTEVTVDDDLDDTYVENLLHLLLRIQRELVCLLVARIVEHISDCQRERSRHSEEWFFEFPDARHPLSTTWPWSIKPSLAVLWGVCWQFFADRFHAKPLFDGEGNLVNERGEIEAPAAAVIAFLSQTQPAQVLRLPQMQAPAVQPFGDPRSRRSVPFPSDEEMAQPSLDGSLITRTSRHQLESHHQPQTHNTTHTAFAPPQPSPQWPLPQASTNFDPTTTYYPAVTTTSWGPVSLSAQQAYTHFQPIGQASSPLPPAYANTPSIRTTDLSPFHQQQSQEFNNNPYSAASNSSSSEISLLRERVSLPHLRNPEYHPGHLSPSSPYMANTIPEAAAEMQTTTPPRSPHHDISSGEQVSRKRSHSQMSGGLPFPPADGSNHGSQMGDEDYAAGRTHVDRPEPLMNDNRKYLCNFGGEECDHLTFDRKCEWSKHMDKHDRPYRCLDPGCAKLQGFTYSGGLLRHEREVHGKHGGPKAQLMCPHPECKRHSGKGFTRKENLNEHVRRVHSGNIPPEPQQPHGDIFKTDDETTFEALAGAARAMEDATDTPASRVSEAVMVEEDTQQQLPAAKRRRQNKSGGTIGSDQHASQADVEQLRGLVEHLQHELAQKDQQLRDMQGMMAEQDRVFQEAQRANHEMFEQHQTAATAAAAIATAATQQA